MYISGAKSGTGQLSNFMGWLGDGGPPPNLKFSSERVNHQAAILSHDWVERSLFSSSTVHVWVYVAADHAGSIKGVYGSSLAAGAKYSDKSVMSIKRAMPLYF